MENPLPESPRKTYRWREYAIRAARGAWTLAVICGTLVALAFPRQSAVASGMYIPGQTLTDPADTTNDNFGFATVMSADGNTLIASGRLFSTGAGVVYLYTRSNGSFSPTPTQTLTDPGTNPGQDGFGGAVALSGDGTLLLVGAAGTATGGVAYLYVKANGSFPALPTQTFTDPANTLDDQFGKAISVSGNGSTLIIGAPGTNSRRGAVYSYTASSSALPRGSRKASGLPGRATVYDPTTGQTVHDPADTPGDVFGDLLAGASDVNVIGVGDRTVFIRAGGTSGHPGKIYLLTVPNGGLPDVTDITPFFDAHSLSTYFQGTNMAASNTGDTLLVGSPTSSGFKGLAFVSALVNGRYTVVKTLTNPGTSGDQFGYAAATSADGNTLLIGTRATSSQPGAAYLYVKVNGSFPDSPTQTFADPAHTNFDFFGIAVAMSGDGATLAIGASNTNSGKGAVYSYLLLPPPTPQPPRHVDGTPTNSPVLPLPTPHPAVSPVSGTIAPQPVRH